MRPPSPTHAFAPLLLCGFFWPLVLSHVSRGALTDLRRTHVLWLQGPPGWAFRERTVLPLRADLAPERAGGSFSPLWHGPAQPFCPSQEVGMEGQGLSAWACRCSHLGLPGPSTPSCFPSEALGSWQPEGQPALPGREMVPWSMGPALLTVRSLSPS